ncbi:MAG: ATP phosphoribosyltransferase regulatory subunit [Saccharofermentanales bacterium]
MTRMSKSNNYKYYTPDGVQDVLPGECAVKREIEGNLRRLFALNGFVEIETPTLEFYDVFAAGEGFAPQEGMFKFFDHSGRILVLRYDGTIPAARVASTVLKEEQPPLKLSYIGNMFRFNEIGGGKQREFTQAGVEILGPRSPEADAQAVELAIESALAAGISDLQVSIGDVEFFNGLLGEWNITGDDASLLQKLIDGKESVTIRDFCTRLGLPGKSGEVLAKMMYSYKTKELIDEMRLLVNNPRSLGALDNLSRVLEILEDCDMAKYISLDLGMLQSLNYYTGIIFKGFTYEIGFPLFSGGRYDNVVGQFGRGMSATGFSLGVNFVMNALRRQGKLPSDTGPGLLVGYGAGGRKAAFDYIRSKRGEGVQVLMDCMGLSPSELADHAASKGIAKAEYVDGQGIVKGLR